MLAISIAVGRVEAAGRRLFGRRVATLRAELTRRILSTSRNDINFDPVFTDLLIIDPFRNRRVARGRKGLTFACILFHCCLAGRKAAWRGGSRW
jgi:hypothetical protein